MSDDRYNFGFPNEVRTGFSFLEDEGFSPASVASDKVRYESDKVYIEILYGERDGEVSISFGRKDTQENFSFTLFLRLVAPLLEKSLGERLVDQPTQMSTCLSDLANALRSEGKAIVAGDDRIFERMRGVRWWDFQPEALK